MSDRAANRLRTRACLYAPYLARYLVGRSSGTSARLKTVTRVLAFSSVDKAGLTPASVNNPMTYRFRVPKASASSLAMT